MKQTRIMFCLTLLLSLFNLYSVKAQDYLSIVKENAEWTVLKITVDTQNPVPPFPTDTSYVTTWIAGDTSIGGINFKKVFNREFFPGSNIPVYQGAIREENQIVTWIPNERDLEQLDTIYNFNLQIGDTVAYYEAMTPFYHYVQNIDSITLEDGFIRKRILIYTKEEGASGEGELINTWIEGLGELQYGLIYPFCQQSNAPRCLDHLICYKEGEAIFYEAFSMGCSVTIFPQENIPFPARNAIWTELRRADAYSNLITIHYGIIGDTIINNKQYQKIYTSADSIFNDSNEDLTYFGGLRISQDQAFILPKISPAFNEHLIYDASFEIGDTLYDGGIETATFGTIIVKSIDSIVLEDGVARKKWNFEAITSQEYYDSTRVEIKRDSAFSWIEGIGNTKCPFKESVRCAFFTFTSRLLCFELNSQKIYRDSKYPDCYFNTIVSTNESSFKSKIELFPNPAHHTIFLRSSNSDAFQKITVKIINTTGQIIRSETIHFDGLHEMNISSLPGGIYFIMLESKGVIQMQKVTKI